MKALIKLLIPMNVTLLLAIPLYRFYVLKYSQVDIIETFEKIHTPSLCDAISLILIALTAISVVYMLIRFRKITMLNKLRKSILIISLVLLFTYYLLVIVPELTIFQLLTAILLFAAVFLFLIIKDVGTYTIVPILLACLASIDLTLILPSTILIYFIVLLCTYDIFLVYFGPLGKLLSRCKSDSINVDSIFKGLVLKLDNNLVIGLGDLVVYSIMVTITISQLSRVGVLYAIIYAFFVQLGIVLGVYLTIKIARRFKGYAPGLPIPVLLWFLTYVLPSYYFFNL